MGDFTSQFTDNCVICKKETNFESWYDDDNEVNVIACCECETNYPIPQLKEGQPFYFGDKLHYLHIGNDDKLTLEDWDE